MRLCELLRSVPEPQLWNLVRQCGVEDAVVLLDGAEQETRWLRVVPPGPATAAGLVPWSEEAIAAQQRDCAAYGLSIAVIEDTPPLERIRRGLPGRDEDIEQVLVQLRAMANLGIPVLCYNWMAVSSWARTDMAVPTRGGALTTGYSHAVAESLPPLAGPDEIIAEQLWDTLAYFLHAVVPEAERLGVRLALHPDDPPIPMARSVPRIISSVDAYRRVLDLHPSRSNAITLCQGNFTLMTDDLPAVITEFCARDAVAFVHFRDVRGDVEDFVETFHDDGKTDLLACMRAYAAAGYDGPMRPDHVPTLYGESNDRPGYATLGRLFALGYIRALEQVAYVR